MLPRPEWLDSLSGQPRSQTLPCPWAPRGNGRERPEEVWNRLGGAPRQAGSALPAWVLQRTLGLLLPPGAGCRAQPLCPLESSGHCPLVAGRRLQHELTVRGGGALGVGAPPARVRVPERSSGPGGSSRLFFLCFNAEGDQEAGVWASWPTNWGTVWGRFCLFCLSFFTCQMELTPLALPSSGGSAASGGRSRVLCKCSSPGGRADGWRGGDWAPRPSQHALLTPAPCPLISKDLAMYINEVKRDKETLKKISEFQSSIENLVSEQSPGGAVAAAPRFRGYSRDLGVGEQECGRRCVRPGGGSQAAPHASATPSALRPGRLPAEAQGLGERRSPPPASFPAGRGTPGSKGRPWLPGGTRLLLLRGPPAPPHLHCPQEARGSCPQVRPSS